MSHDSVKGCDRNVAPPERTPAAVEAVRRVAANGSNPNEVEATVRNLIFAWHLDWARRVLRRVSLLLAALCAAGAAPAAATERAVLGDVDGHIGLLSMPGGPEPVPEPAPVPVVILVHDSLGTDRRTDLTVRQLLDAGIATLEVELYAVSADGANGAEFFDPYAEAEFLNRARRALGTQPGIDPMRIAALGFGRGAHAVAGSPDGYAQDWVARVFLYPDCGTLAGSMLAGPRTSLAPLLVLHGDTGAGDPPRDCLGLGSRLEHAGVPVRITHYRHAAHGWDLPPIGDHGISFQPAPVGQDRLRSVAWPELAELSATHAAGFLAAAINGRLRSSIFLSPSQATSPGP